MNWVGGARSRLRMKYEKKQQKEYFEKKRYARKVKTVRPLSPGSTKRKGGISQDLLYLHTLNTAHSMDKKGFVNPTTSRQVNKVDLSKLGPALPSRRQEDLELPNMSPDYSKTPSVLLLADTEDSKPPCQHYLSYDDWLSRTSGKVADDTPDNPQHLFKQTARLSTVAPHTSNREVQVHGTPFVPYTTPGPKSDYKDPFRKFASSSSLVKFEENHHSPDHDFAPSVGSQVNLPRTPGSAHKRRRLAGIPSSGRSVRTPSTFSSSSQSSLGSPIEEDKQEKAHEETHRPILLQQSAQSDRPSLHNWLNSVSGDMEKGDTNPDKTTPSTTDGETLPAGKRRRLDFGDPCSTYTNQQRASVKCNDTQAHLVGTGKLQFNTWDALCKEETADHDLSIKPELSTPVTQRNDQTAAATGKESGQKGYQATLQNLMSVPLTWVKEQPADSKQQQESQAVVDEGFPAETQQFTLGSAPRTGEVLSTPTKDVTKRIKTEDMNTEVSIQRERDPFSPLSSQESLCLSSGVESLSSLDLSEASEEQEVKLSQEELHSLEETLSDVPNSTSKEFSDLAAEPNTTVGALGVDDDVSDCLQLLLALVEWGNVQEDVDKVTFSPEDKHQGDLVTCPQTSRCFTNVNEPTKFLGTENTAVVKSTHCPDPSNGKSAVAEGEAVVKEVIDLIVKDITDGKQLTDVQQDKLEVGNSSVFIGVEYDGNAIVQDLVGDDACVSSFQNVSKHSGDKIKGNTQNVRVEGQDDLALEQHRVGADASVSPCQTVPNYIGDKNKKDSTKNVTDEEQDAICTGEGLVEDHTSVSTFQHVSKHVEAKALENKSHNDQQTQTVIKTEDAEMQTEAGNSSTSETNSSQSGDQDLHGPLQKSASSADKSTQTQDEEGVLTAEESAGKVDECERKVQSVLDKVRGLPEPCRREQQLLTMLSEVEELIVKLESAHILQTLKDGLSAEN